MRVSLGQLKSSEASIMELSKTVLPINIGYRLGKFIKKIASELKEFEESRVKLVTKYGVEDPETKNIQVPKEKTEEFMKEFQELLSIEVDLEWDQLDLSGIEIGKEIKLNTQDILNLEWLCKFE
jgi:predicted nucleotidyltransferase